MTTPFGEWKDIPQNGQDFYYNETGKSRGKDARYLTMIQKGNTEVGLQLSTFCDIILR